MEGIAGVQARIAEIQAQFASMSGAPTPASATSATASSATDFSTALAQAQSSAGTQAATAAGPATTSREQWANDFLTQLGMPVTSENVKAMVAWQQAEGTRAQYNPLATTQNMPGATRFNPVGVKNFVSYQDGLTANIKAITNGRYTNILDALRAGNNANAVAQAIAASPWGTGALVERILSRQQ